jgi:peroxiredoxin
VAILAKELQAFRASLAGRISRDLAASFARAEAELQAAGAGQQAPREGDLAGDFTLPDEQGRPVRLYALLEQGPVVLVFYRGGWCPFCTISLRALQLVARRLRALGATLIAISPELPVHARTTSERNRLDFPLLHDAANRVADEWHLVHELHPDLRPTYARLGHAIPEMNGTSDWKVPVPAGYVIAPDRRIVLAHVDPRIYVRMEPADAVTAVAALEKQSSAG